MVVLEQRKETNYMVVLRYQKAWHLVFRNAQELAVDLMTGAKDIAEYLLDDLDKSPCLSVYFSIRTNDRRGSCG